MPKKEKELIEHQSCEKCQNFDLNEDHGRCARCKKEVTFSAFRPNEEEKLRAKMRDDPKFKDTIKKISEEI